MSAPAIPAIKAVMSVARDLAEGRLAVGALETQAAAECRELFGTVVGPDDPLWELHGDVTRQYLAAGGMPATELSEWLAVQRQRDGVEPKGESWIEPLLEALAANDDGDDDDG